MSFPILNSFWSFWNDQPKHRRYLRELVDVRPDNASDIETEQFIRGFFYSTLNWTGNQDPEITPHTDSPVDLLRGIERLRKKNDGRGPEISCGPFAAIYVGLLAAHDIPARRVWSCSLRKDAPVRQDNVAEVWLGGRWALVVPQLNCHFMFQDGGLMSLTGWATHDRVHYFPPHVVTLSGGLPSPLHPDTAPNLNSWIGMSGNPCVMRGNAPFAGAGTWPPEAWDYMQVLPACGDALDPVETGAVRKLWKFGEYDERSVTADPKTPYDSTQS